MPTCIIFVCRASWFTAEARLNDEILALNPRSYRDELTGILKEEELRSMRSKELNTQIQYKLLEQLQKQTESQKE